MKRDRTAVRHPTEQWAAAFDSVDDYGIGPYRDRQHDGLGREFVDPAQVRRTKTADVRDLKSRRTKLEDSVPERIPAALVPHYQPLLRERVERAKDHVFGHAEADAEFTDPQRLFLRCRKSQQDTENTP